jgi:hypothetical protein
LHLDRISGAFDSGIAVAFSGFEMETTSAMIRFQALGLGLTRTTGLGVRTNTWHHEKLRRRLFLATGGQPTEAEL